MAKKERTPSYLTAKALIAKGYYKEEEAEKYKENRQKIQVMNLRQRGNELSSEEKYRRQSANYGRTRTGRFGNALTKGFKTTSQRGGVSRSLYRREGQLPPTNVQNRFKTVQGNRTGVRGRPVGTVDRRYAAYGGVYGYRKAMALERFKQRQQILNNSAASPQQQAILNQIRARQQYAQSNPEGRVIPDTRGDIFLDGIMDEINRASNAVG